jgi:hypothetical protein
MVTKSHDNRNWTDYCANFDRICACVKGSPEHTELLHEEKRLNNRGVAIKRALGILAIDPGPKFEISTRSWGRWKKSALPAEYEY